MAKKVDRAAQFLPFDALKGLQDELRLREERRSRVEKITLCDDMVEELSIELAKVQRGSEIEMTFYKGGHYYDIQSVVTGVNYPYKYLIIGQEKVYFDDIYQLKVTSV